MNRRFSPRESSILATAAVSWMSIIGISNASGWSKNDGSFARAICHQSEELLWTDVVDLVALAHRHPKLRMEPGLHLSIVLADAKPQNRRVSSDFARDVGLARRAF